MVFQNLEVNSIFGGYPSLDGSYVKINEKNSKWWAHLHLKDNTGLNLFIFVRYSDDIFLNMNNPDLLSTLIERLKNNSALNFTYKTEN